MGQAMRLNGADIASYDRDGAVCLRGVFDMRWIDLLRAGVERNLREPGRYAKRYTPEGQPGMFFGDYCNWDRIPEYHAFFHESPAKEAAGELMRSSKVNLFHAKTHENIEARFEQPPDVDALRDQFTILGWPLEPGDCLAFHGLTLHGAPGNASNNRRRAFSARFTGDDARFVLRDGFMSPPPPESGGPCVGAPMDSAAFPVIWRRKE